MAYGHLCSGTIINPHHPNDPTSIWVLTAASCVYPLNPADLYVVAGTNTRWDCSPGLGVIDLVQYYQIPELYDTGACLQSDDLAILRLRDPLPIGGPIQIAPLPPDNSDQFVGLTAVAQGWGETELGPFFPCSLQKAAISVVSNAYANAVFPEAMRLCDGQLAVNDDTISTTPCRGDEGAGLYGPIGDVPTLIGVNSWGVDCSASWPYVTTRVSSYLPWIYYVTQ
jgi:secreted trypsin-like serine protease